MAPIKKPKGQTTIARIKKTAWRNSKIYFKIII